MKVAYVLILSAALVGGCKKNKPVEASKDFGPETSTAIAAPAASPEALRDALLASDSSLRVGIVSQVDLRAMTAVIAGVNEADFAVGSVLTINDLSQQPVADASVTTAASGNVTVRYHVIAGGRPPREGDLAIKFAK